MTSILSLTPFMFTADNVQYKDRQADASEKIKKTRGAMQPATSLYHPKQRDALFWCFYIVLEGMAQYEQVKSRCFATEKAFKIAAVEKLRERADELKAHKLKRNDVEDALVNRPKITLAAFQALCLLYGVSFVYTKGSVYYEFAYGEGEPSVVVVEKGRPSLYTGNDAVQYAANIRKGRWHVEDPAKPIRAVSAYTLGELREFCDRLNLEHDGLKKAQLYQLIREKIM
jgi:hypothetical protein